MAVVVLLFVCGWISIINAQPNAPTLSPREPQSVCRGESISYNCIGDGRSVALFSPPIVNESTPLSVFSDDTVPTCPVRTNSAVSITLVDPTASPSLLMGTFTLYISYEQSEGQRTVSCRIPSADGTVTTLIETTFSVLGTPSNATSLTFQETGYSTEDMTQVPVNISWNSPENAQEFMLQIISENTNYNNTFHSLESSVTTFLPYGAYSATLCAINRCGKTCRDYPNIFSAKARPVPRPKDNSLVIAAVIAGVLGLLLIFASIYGVIVTVIICKKDK